MPRITIENGGQATPQDVADACATYAAKTLTNDLYWITDSPDMRSAAVAAIAARGDDFVDEYLSEAFGSESVFDFPLAIARALVRDGFPPPEIPGYLQRISWRRDERGYDTRTDDEKAVDWKHFLERDLWRIFTTEGAGADWRTHWKEELAELAATDDHLRSRLLDATLAGLTRDFSAFNIAAYVALHRLLAPTPAEVVTRASAYERALLTEPGSAVALAQEFLRPVVDRLGDVSGLLAASRSVLLRSDKRSVVAQLAILKDVAAAHPDRVAEVAQIVAELEESPKPDLALKATKLRASLGVVATGSPDRAAETATAVTDAAAPAVPGPRTAALLPLPRADRVIDDPDELAVLFARVLEDPSPADDVRVAVESALRLRDRRPAESGGLAARALDLVWAWELRQMSLRARLAGVVLAWLGVPYPAPSFPGEIIVRYGPPEDGFTEPVREFSPVRDGRDLTARDRWVPGEQAPLEGSLVARPTWAPSALVLLWLEETAAVIAEPGRAAPVSAALSEARHAAPRRSAEWGRAHTTAKGGFYSQSHLYIDARLPYWADATAETASLEAIEQAPFDLSLMERDYEHRIERAREKRDYDAIVALWIPLFDGASDYAAAHAHPALYAATRFVNVQGTAPVIEALGSTRVPLGAPSHSALALALSDVSAEGRSRAAEAIAALAASGFLRPDVLAEQVRLALADGHLVLARVVAALDDASSVSAVSGWRCLDTLELLLDDAVTLTGGNKLVALAARLSVDYGRPLAIPPALAAKGTGSSAMAIAVRTLRAAPSRATPLSDRARDEAAAALVG